MPAIDFIHIPFVPYSRYLCLLLNAQCSLPGFVREQNSGEIPFFLLLQQPNGAMKLNANLKYLPRHCFISRQETTSVVHEACSQLLPNFLLDQILCLYPEVSRLLDQNGDSIAHAICSHKQSTLEMVKTLRRHYPSIFSIQNNNGDIPLHLINSEEHSEDIIKFLLSTDPQTIMVQNKEMHTPLSSRSIRYSRNKAKTMVQMSDIQLVRSILNSGTSLTVIGELFYYLQQHVSSICHSLQAEVNSFNFRKVHMNNLQLAKGTEYLFLLMTVLHYNVIEWPNSNTEPKTMGSFTHNGAFWLQFPIFTKMLLQHHPEIAFQLDSNGNLPLHILAKYNWSPFHLSCAVCNDIINDGVFYWVNMQHQRCSGCQTKCKRGTRFDHVPLITCHGK